MKTGFLGTFVIPWSQTETDGHAGAPVKSLLPGATWRWSGRSLRVDGPNEIATLAEAEGVADLHKRAARKVRRLIVNQRAALAELAASPQEAQRRVLRQEARNDALANDGLMVEQSFTVTDGTRAWMGTWVETAPDAPVLLMFVGDVPPEGRDLWVSRAASFAAGHLPFGETPQGGVICFTAGTRIATPDGPRAVENLRPGDLVTTADDGAQPITWRGARRMTGARFFALPKLRPIRLAAGVLGPDVPEGDLLVSPNHRMIIRGAAARALFNEAEVLVRARDLEGLPGIRLDTQLPEATYVHLLLERHQILFANGVATESFHPSEADMGTLDPGDRARLLNMMPGVDTRPDGYGQPARRGLTGAEAAILKHGLNTSGPLAA